MLRGLFTLVFIAAAAWSGYWWLGATAQDTAMRTWLDDRRADGWVSDYSSLEVAGYPNRFDTTVTDLNLADPRSGWAWAAPMFQVLALSYQPNHIIAIWPHEQVVSTPDERISVGASQMRASVVFEANTDLALDRTVLIIEEMTLKSTANWSSSLKKATLTTEQTVEEPFAHDIGFLAEEFRPARIFKAIVDPSDLMPDVFDVFKVRGTIAYDAPWDRHAIEGDKPLVTRIDLDEFNATWGELDFQATGSVEVDRLGYLNGEVAVRAKNWKDMLTLAVNSGVVSQDVSDALAAGLSLIAGLSGNPDTLDAPLSFSNQLMKLGPIPIGPAPRLTVNHLQ